MIVPVLTTHFHSRLHSLKAPLLPTQINGWRIGGLMNEWVGIDGWKQEKTIWTCQSEECSNPLPVIGIASIT